MKPGLNFYQVVIGFQVVILIVVAIAHAAYGARCDRYGQPSTGKPRCTITSLPEIRSIGR